MIYLDHNATTPVDPRVLEAMLPYFTDRFGNAASRQHGPGSEAADAVEQARVQVADAIGADPREIVWTSGATESNNLALKGVAASKVHADRRSRIVTVRTEHPAVLDPCDELQRRGFEIVRLAVPGSGRIELDSIAHAIDERTMLVSVMFANNETGVLQPVDRIGEICRERGAIFHTDATQAFLRESIDVQRDGIHLLSLSGHKAYGPKGVGALYVRRKRPRVRCEPLLHGGGHERGLRSGTLNVPGIVGLGVAAAIGVAEMKAERERLRRLRDRLEGGLLKTIERVSVNGDTERRLTHTLNVSFLGLDAEALMQRVPEIAVSSASACASAARMPSHVLGAMGASDEAIRGSVRFSLGRFTTEAEIDETIGAFVEACRSVRAAVNSGPE